MDKPPFDTLVPQRRGVGRWPVTLTTERANPLRRWNPGWGGCSTARRPVAAVKQTFPEALGLRQALPGQASTLAGSADVAAGWRCVRSVAAATAMAAATSPAAIQNA